MNKSTNALALMQTLAGEDFRLISLIRLLVAAVYELVIFDSLASFSPVRMRPNMGLVLSDWFIPFFEYPISDFRPLAFYETVFTFPTALIGV